MSAVNDKDLLSRLPLVDLHVHLDGSVRPDTLIELAQEQGAPLPSSIRGEELRLRMQVGDHCDSLVEYLEKFDFVLPYLQTASALERVAFETVEQFAAAGGKYMEVRFAPLLHVLGGLTADEAMAAVLAGLKRAEAQLGVPSRGIVICMRHHAPSANMELVEAASAYAGRGIAAVDLAGDEASYPPMLHREVFERAGRLGIPATIHAGEAAGPDNIYDAVVRLGARRIGHGVRAREKREVMQLLRQRGIPLEMCPVSNLQTKAVPDWGAYPIREYFEEGLVLTVNTDNPTVSGTTLVREYGILMERFGFALEEIAVLLMNGIRAAFLEESGKNRLIGQFRSSLQGLGIKV